ncbi:hypothetical protein GWI33_013392 [Rhynchophorus ferrugineus]|uniref:Reverse transcriptase domain-containing protein n=1 Tax=Rhynchophorus ferrugineus TaxID=354439 RepID=A0A834MA04_RHYFE|nr:hypothetical protein GWI33_013392 [Rhynchophorus ferrugineus]
MVTDIMRLKYQGQRKEQLRILFPRRDGTKWRIQEEIPMFENEEIPMFENEEIWKAANALKSCKTPGTDGIPVDMSYQNREWTVLLTLDIKNAFNSASCTGIVDQLRSKNISAYLLSSFRGRKSSLRGRTVDAGQV